MRIFFVGQGRTSPPASPERLATRPTRLALMADAVAGRGLWRDVLPVRRSRKPAENAAWWEKDYLWMETSYPDINICWLLRYKNVSLNSACLPAPFTRRGQTAGSILQCFRLWSLLRSGKGGLKRNHSRYPTRFKYGSPSGRRNRE